MARTAVAQNNFNAGEVSPLLLGRLNLQKVQNACELCENFMPLPWGVIQRRPGTVFLVEVKDSAKKTRLVTFEFSTIQAYGVELSEGAIRFLKDRAQIVAPDVATAISNGTFTSNVTGWSDESSGGTAAIAHDSTNGRLNLVGDASETAAAEQTITVASGDQAKEHVLRFDLFGAAGDPVTVDIGTTSGGGELHRQDYAPGYHCIAVTPATGTIYLRFTNAQDKTVAVDNVAFIAGDAPVEIGAPWEEDELALLQYTQSADVMYITQPGNRVYKLERYGHSAWSLVEVDWLDGPYLDENTTDTTLTPGATTGLSVTVTASAVTGINRGDGFKSTDVGRLVRIKHSTSWGWGRIVAVTDTKTVKLDVKGDFGATTASSAWQLGLWSDTDGWPAAARFHEQRLNMTGAGAVPDRLDGSASGDFENFAPGTDDDDAYAYKMSSGKVNAGRWLAAVRRLLVGTVGQEFQVGATATTEPLTPTNVTIRPETNYGADPLRALEVANAALFVARHGRKIREMAFGFDVDGYRAPDLTILAEHITQGGIVDWAFQQEPWSVVWAVRADGVLLAMTYERAEEVVGWSWHSLGGTPADGALFGAVVEAVTVVPGEGVDDVYLVVKRTIDGQTKRYIERLADRQEELTPIEDLYFVDCGLTLDNTMDATLTPSAKTGSGVTFTAGSSVFASSDVGRDIRRRYKARDAWGRVEWRVARARITGYSSGTEVTGTVYPNEPFPSTDMIPAGAWRMTVTQISGLDHLEGESVQVLGDGAVQPEKTVSGGAITLTSKAATVHVGLGSVARLVPHPLLGGTREGDSQGRMKRIASVAVRFWRSMGLRYGPDPDHLDRLPFRTTDDQMNTAIPLFTGWKRFPFGGNSEREPRMLFIQDLPLPATIGVIAPVFETREK